MSASSARCAVCVEPVRDQGARCPRCGVFYHPACFSEGGCVVPGCTPGRTAEAAVRMNSRLWGPAVSSMVFACALAYLTVEVAWGARGSSAPRSRSRSRSRPGSREPRA